MKNSLILGILLGLFFPMIAFLLLRYTDLSAQIMPSKPFGFYIIAVTINMVGVWIFYKRGFDNIGKGLILITFLSMLMGVFTKTIII